VSCIFCISQFTFFGHSGTVCSHNSSDSKQECIASYHMFSTNIQKLSNGSEHKSQQKKKKAVQGVHK